MAVLPGVLVCLILPLGPTEGPLEDFMPKLDGILETAIHTKDMVRARALLRGRTRAGADL